MNMDRTPAWPLDTHSLTEAEARLQRTGQLASEPLGSEKPGMLGLAPGAAEPPKPVGAALPQDLGTPCPLPSYMPNPRHGLHEPQLATFENQVPFLQLRHVHHVEARCLAQHKFKQALEQVGFQRIAQKLQEILPPTWVEAEWAPVPTAAVIAEVKILGDEGLAQVNQHLAAWTQWYDALPAYVRTQLPPAPGPFRYKEPQ